MNIQTLTTRQLLELFTELREELECRSIVRSANNPVGDYTEYLVAKAFSLKLMPSSTTGYDAVNAEGVRYEIKGRKITRNNLSRELSAIRGLEFQHFAWLAGVLFNEDFSVLRACLIPHDTVLQLAVYKKHGDRHIITLRDAVWTAEGVLDITQPLLSAQNF